MIILPRLDRWEDFSELAMKVARGDGDEELAHVVNALEEKGIASFLASNPTYYASPKNGALLESWLFLHGDVPATRLNLETAFRALDPELEQAPPPEAAPTDTGRGIVVEIGHTLAEAVESEAEAKALRSVRDRPDLSDAERKDRDRRLALLAGAQRRALAGEWAGQGTRVVGDLAGGENTFRRKP